MGTSNRVLPYGNKIISVLVHTFPSQNTNDEIILKMDQAVVGFSNNLPTGCLKKIWVGEVER